MAGGAVGLSTPRLVLLFVFGVVFKTQAKEDLFACCVMALRI